MQIKIKFFYVILAVLALMAGFYGLGYIKAHRQGENALESLNSLYADSIKYYQVSLKGLERTVAEQSQALLTKQQAIDMGLIDKDKYRKLYLKTIDQVTELKATVDLLLDSLNTDADVIYVPVGDSMPDKPCAELPFNFWEKNEYVDLFGTVNTSANVDLRLTLPVDLDITVGIKKKADKPSVLILTDNPYVKIDNIRSIKIEKKEYFWDKGWFKFGSGMLVGGVMVGLID